MVTPALWGLLLVACGQAEAPSRDGAEPAAAKDARLAWFQQLVADQPVRLQQDDGRKIELEQEPILRWSSPQAGILDGAVFLWLHDRRPLAVVGPFWAPRHGGLYVQFHSLAAKPLTIEQDGVVVWNPEPPAVQWSAVPDSPPPAKTERERLGQMRDMARGFRATAVKGPPNYELGSKWQLRLMPQPLYRYASPGVAVVDGAVFALSLGTDPELFVLLEAQGGDDERAWRYALAPWCESELVVEYRDRQVWHRPDLAGWDPKSAYYRTGPTAIEPPPKVP